MAEDEVTVDSALNFILRGHHVSKEDKDRLHLMVKIVSDEAIKHGLAEKQIKNLASRVIISDSYSLNIRRKLLYSLIPVKPDCFPHAILPFIMSSVFPAALDNPKGTGSWAASVLSWLSSLLRFNVIDTDNMHVRICYLPCFNLLGNFKLAHHCANIIYELTRRVDVTPLRIKLLLKLKRLKLFTSPYTKLLRLFSTMRPDLIVVCDESLALPREVPPCKQLQAGLQACSRRVSTALHDPQDMGDALWPSANKRQRFSLHDRSSAIPVPKVVQHSDKLEENKAQHINVMECTKLRQLVSTISRSSVWLWPNNPASLMQRPHLLLWFRPHDYRAVLQLESWLDLALTSEILRERDTAVSAERSRDLLHQVTVFAEQQVLAGMLCSPVIQQFLLSYLMCWDQQQNFSLVLRLVCCLGYIESFRSVVVSRLLPLLATAPLPVACAVVRCFTDVAVNWCLHYRHNAELEEEEGFAMVEGVLEMGRLLENGFIACCLAHSLHPMLLHSVLSFYSTVNACLDHLVLPLVLCPHPPLTALLLSVNDIGVTHALGSILARLPAAYSRIDDEFVRRGFYEDFCSEVFTQTPQHNKAIELFSSAVYDAYVFAEPSECWREMCLLFLGAKQVARAEKVAELRTSMSLVTGLQTVALYAQVLEKAGARDYSGKDSDEIKAHMMAALSERGFSGIADFLAANKEGDSPVLK